MSERPADTRMMRIVHQALRRDLQRAHVALSGTPEPSLRQQQAIARHLRWMMGFLRAHHDSEDEGLFPLVRERDPAAAGLLDAMHADHEAIAPMITAVEAAAAAYDDSDASGQIEPLLTALGDLAVVLNPHLQREEDEMMPVVSSVITDSEWRTLENRYNIEPKSFVELGREGHWLIDGVSDEDRRLVVGLVPAVPRFILVHGFGRSYRRRAASCWSRSTERRVQKNGRCAVRVDAEIDAVWNIVRDPTRVGEWSHECVGVEWLGDATAAVPGARFRGRNRAGIFRWGRVCEVVTAEPYEFTWRTVSSLFFPDSTEWSIRLHRVDRGTEVEQLFVVLRAPKLLDILYARMIPSHRERTEALTADLRRLGDLTASPAAAAVD